MNATTTPTAAVRPLLTPAERAAFVERLHPVVRKFCHLIAPAHDADDVMQNTLVTVWMKADAFDPTQPGKVESWACAIARNFAFQARDKRKRFALPFTDLQADDDATPFDPAEPVKGDPSGERPARINRVREVLDRLPAADRKLIVRQFERGTSDLDEAARLGLTAVELDERAAAALGKLKAKLLAVSP